MILVLTGQCIKFLVAMDLMNGAEDIDRRTLIGIMPFYYLVNSIN